MQEESFATLHTALRQRQEFLQALEQTSPSSENSRISVKGELCLRDSMRCSNTLLRSFTLPETHFVEWSEDDEDKGTPTFATFLERGVVYRYSLMLATHHSINGGLNLVDQSLWSIFFFGSLSVLGKVCEHGEGQWQPFAGGSNPFGCEGLGAQKVSEKHDCYCSLFPRLSHFINCNELRSGKRRGLYEEFVFLGDKVLMMIFGTLTGSCLSSLETRVQ